MNTYLRPSPLSSTHDVSDFDCGNTILNQWLRNRAMRNQQSGASRTFVTLDERSGHIVGYYCLAATSVRLGDAPGVIRRNMPDPIPAILLGRLAVHRHHQGEGLGRGLLQDSVRRVLRTADSVGVRALVVHAIDDPAAKFYQRFDFVASPTDDHILFLPVPTMRASVGEHVA